MIDKVAGVILKDNKLLLVRSHSQDKFLMPGGKREGNEDDIAALRRELKEELSCDLRSARFLTELRGKAEYEDEMLKMRLYLAEISGNIKPSSEVAEFAWMGRDDKIAVSGFFEKLIYPELIIRRLI